MKAKFTGHDTFPLRYGWLYKAVNHLNSGGKLQTSKEEETQHAIIKLGVGKNMVNAIRYWAESASLVDSKRELNNTIFNSSENGNYLLCEHSGKDPYLEYSGSIWLIHFWLCFNDKEITAYRYFFNHFNGEYFEKQILLAHMAADIKKLTTSDTALNENTLQKDIDTFLNTYCKKLKQNLKQTEEEQFNSPLAELNLIHDNGKNYYLSDLNEKEELPIQIFIYALLSFVQKESKISNVAKINFKSLLFDAYSPGRIFRLTEKGLGAKLDQAQLYSDNNISWIDSLGLRQITIDESYLTTELTVLNAYYKECSNG